MLKNLFTITPLITPHSVPMIKDRVKSGKEALACKGNDSSVHARIDYKISIKYNKTLL